MEVLKVNEFQGHKGGVYSLVNAKENHLVYAGGSEHLIIEWNLYEPNTSKAFVRLPIKAYAMQLIHEQNLLLVGNLTGGIHVIDLIEKKEIKLLQFHTGTIFDIQFIPTKNEFVVASADGHFTIWNSLTFELLLSKKITDKKVRAIAYNKQDISFACSDKSIHVFNLSDYQLKKKIQVNEEERFLNCLTYHPNKNILITGSRGFLSFWDISQNYQHINQIAAHQFAIYSIVFSPNNKWMATASMDKVIRIWDANTFELKKEINRKDHGGHTNSVNKLLWSNYNDYLISASDDRTVMIWKITD